MRGRAILCLSVMLAAGQAYAQPPQPAAEPSVTADNTSWYLSAAPITWNGDLYYPAGALQAFDPDRMLRSGAFQGTPLYTDDRLETNPLIEPRSIVFVPVSGGRVQPYERRRAGVFAGTTASHTPLAIDIPTAVDTEPSGLPALPERVGTSGRTGPDRQRAITSAIPPTGANAIWVNFNGRRFYAAGQSIRYDASVLDEIGTYQGWTVYAQKSDASRGTIYIASMPGRLSVYRVR